MDSTVEVQTNGLGSSFQLVLNLVERWFGHPDQKAIRP
jgi:hypothetical protein